MRRRFVIAARVWRVFWNPVLTFVLKTVWTGVVFRILMLLDFLAASVGDI